MQRSMSYLTCLILALGTVGCGDEPTGLGGFGLNVGVYAAAEGEPSDYGRFELVTPGAPARDLIAEGAALEVDLRRGGELRGRLFVPAGIEGLEPADATLEGTWKIEGSEMILSPEAGTLLDGLRFRAEAGGLMSEETLGGARLVIELEFEHVALTDPTLDSETSAFELTPHRELDPSRGTRGVLVMRSRRGNPLALSVATCMPLLRVYHEGELVYDQAEDARCTGSFRIHRVESGEILELRTPYLGLCRFIRPGLPNPGFYDWTVYLPFGDEELEIPILRALSFCSR